MTKRIGLFVGREWSFPPAFMEAVSQRKADVVAEYVSTGALSMTDPVPYDVLIDRISHEVPFYRSYLKHAVLQGVPVINNPFMWTADDKFFGASLITRLGLASPKTLLLPNKDYIPGIKHDESLRNLQFPLDWEGIARHVGMPCILKDAHGGGWKEVHVCRSLEELIARYDQSGLLTMIVQEFIEWDEFVRCLCIGQEDILPIKYDPRERRYIPDDDFLTPALRTRVIDDARTHRSRPGLRHELDRVRHPRRGSLRDRLHESGPRHGHQLPDAALLRLGGPAHGRPGDRAGQEAAASGEGSQVGQAVYEGTEGAMSSERPSCRAVRDRRLAPNSELGNSELSSLGEA